MANSQQNHQHQLAPLPLPPGVTFRQLDLTGPSLRSLNFYILEAGYTPSNDRPLIILLHGFPELAFSWRKILPRLATAGFYVVAPDQRGFGRTTGWDTRAYSSVDLSSFTVTMLVRDIVVLVNALGYRRVRCVVGHDAGGITAAHCALIRPDLFESVVLMSHPFNGSPTLPLNVGVRSHKDQAQAAEKRTPQRSVHDDLYALGRRHYKWYYSSESAHRDLLAGAAPGDLHAFLRDYFHLKSADWAGNNPHPLQSWTAAELVQLPYYYVMPQDTTMPEAVSLAMQDETAENRQKSLVWLPDSDLDVYVSEYSRTGFQGGLNWYRIFTGENPRLAGDLDIFAGKKIEVPCAFVGGKKDWGMYQQPGAIEKMVQGVVCQDFRVLDLIDGAGHWMPQEKPDEVVKGILQLIHSLDK